MSERRMKRITQAAIAKATGFSRSTVGHVLNGKARDLHISSKAEEVITEMARKHGYLANNAALRLRDSHNNDQTHIIAFIITFNSKYPNLPFGGLAIINRLIELGYQTLIINIDKSTSEIPPLFLNRNFDGMIIYGAVSNYDFFTKWGTRHKIPYVFLNHENQLENNVGIDEQLTAVNLIDKIKRFGYKRVGFYFQRKTSLDYLNLRERCVRDAVLANRIEYCPDTIQQHKADENTAAYLMSLPNPPDCVVTYNFDHGMHFYQELNKLGLSVPEDVAVVTYDLSPYCKTTTPPLCAISFDDKELGTKTAEMIVKRIETGKSQKNQSIKGKLVFECRGVRLESLS